MLRVIISRFTLCLALEQKCKVQTAPSSKCRNNVSLLHFQVIAQQKADDIGNGVQRTDDSHSSL